MIDKIKKQIDDLEKRRKELFALKEPIDKELVSSANKIDKLKNKLDTLKIKDGVDWNYLLDINTGMVSYQECQNRLHKFSLYGPDGYIPELIQRCFKIMLYKNNFENSLEKVFNGLTEILPFVKTYTSGDFEGFKYINIFEHTLSSCGSYYCLIKENCYKLMQDRYHRTYEIKKFDSLMELLKYIQENHYYQ